MMRFQHKVLLTSSLLVLCYLPNIAAAQTVPKLAEQTLAATVYLEMRDRAGDLSYGSGFFVARNLIATNYHVIAGAKRGTAKRVGKDTTYTIEGVVGTDAANDLALLKVSAYGVPHLALGNSDTVRIGETIYVAGNPKGLEGTFSDGLISSWRGRYTQKERLQLTAPISPGSSGGPVLNRRGQVIGVAFATIGEDFAIPAKYLRKLIDRSKYTTPISLGQADLPFSAETYLILGYAKYYISNHQGAIDDYTQAIRLKPNYAEAYTYRGDAKASLGQHFAAITDYDTAIRIKPDFVLAYTYRGRAKYSLEQYAAAIADYDEAIRIKPDFSFAYCDRGDAKSKLGQYFAAITDYDTAIRIYPNHPFAYNNRGLAKAGLKQYFAAIADFDTAIRINPDDSIAYANRGLSNEMLRRAQEARQDYQTALRLAKQTGDTKLQATIESRLR